MPVKLLKKGMKGKEVRHLQELLLKNLKLNESKFKIDGDFGKLTDKATREFQKKTKLSVDGKAGPATFGALAKKGDSKSRKFAESIAKKAPKESQAKSGDSKGKITGKKSGVNTKIIAFVQGVADHYGATININSGKRTNKEQGEIMYKYWVKNLKRGNLYIKIRSDKKLQKKLDDLYEKAKGGDSAAKKEFVETIAKDATSYSRHVTGQAIDIPKNTPTNIRNALKTGLREVVENLCFHYDNRKISTPTVNDALRAKWKK